VAKVQLAHGEGGGGVGGLANASTQYCINLCLLVGIRQGDYTRSIIIDAIYRHY
jgi:hypothetical protein